MTDVATIADALAAAEPREPRPLGELLARLEMTGGVRGARDGGKAIGPNALATLAVRGVTDDTRRLRPGSLFVAIGGGHVDGHDLLGEAAGQGAVAAVVERAVESRLPQVVVPASRAALADAAAWWYGDPSRSLGVVGITGTDGKTTTSFLAVAALEATGLSTGLVGTIETKVGGLREAHAEHLTTPGAPDLQLALRAMATAGNRAAVLETTSHGLATDRVRAVAYDAAILTNLSHEHLEFHGSWEAYRDAKLSLFERLAPGASGTSRAAKEPPAPGWPRTAIVNADDPSAGAFVGVAQEAGATIVTYGADAAADIRLTRVEEDGRRLRVAYATRHGDASLELRLAGRFNAYNALAVVALGQGLGLDADAIRAGLESVEAVPGRMETIDAGQPFGVVVDFAHTPASLQAVLDGLAPVAAARGGGLIAVFGSAGERDTDKRPMMGRIAGERCRLVVVTDEDPRLEDRETILEAIAAGAEEAGRRRDRDLLLIPDRRAAIAAAFERARPGDVVLLAGKGHETSIIGAGGPVEWDERQAALDALAALGHGF